METTTIIKPKDIAPVLDNGMRHLCKTVDDAYAYCGYKYKTNQYYKVSNLGEVCPNCLKITAARRGCSVDDLCVNDIGVTDNGNRSACN